MNKIELNSARNCLRYIIKAFNIKEIYIPYYHCPSIRSAIYKENCKIHFYHIDKNFYPIEELPQNAFILYTNYFGVCEKISEELSLKYKNFIIDNAHAFYSAPKGIASFNSLRKFFPKLRDGAFLYTSKTLDEKFPADEYFYEYKSLSYKELCINENRLDKEEIKFISAATKNYCSNININEEQKKRTELYKELHKNLGKINCLKLSYDINAPFGYPFLAKNKKQANELAEELNKKGINIFRYWNNLPDSYEEKIFYTNLAVISLNTAESVLGIFSSAKSS